MGEAAFWGLIGASSLVVAAEIAFAFQLSRIVIGRPRYGSVQPSASVLRA